MSPPGRPGAACASILASSCASPAASSSRSAVRKTVLTASRTGDDVLRIAGAIYLASLGAHTLMHPRRAPTASEESTIQAELARGLARFTWGRFLLGLTTDLLNPKVGVFFVSFIPQFIPHAAPITAYTRLLGALYILGTAAWFALLLWLAARIGGWLRRPRTQQWLQRVTGVTLVGFAVGMLADAR
jgi:threonine/homoserine/homoserine lactone efflux protein